MLGRAVWGIHITVKYLYRYGSGQIRAVNRLQITKKKSIYLDMAFVGQRSAQVTNYYNY